MSQVVRVSWRRSGPLGGESRRPLEPDEADQVGTVQVGRCSVLRRSGWGANSIPAADDLRRILRRVGWRPRAVLRGFWVRFRTAWHCPGSCSYDPDCLAVMLLVARPRSTACEKWKVPDGMAAMLSAASPEVGVAVAASLQTCGRRLFRPRSTHHWAETLLNGQNSFPRIPTLRGPEGEGKEGRTDSASISVMRQRG
jgi:hypothetical protein